MYYDSSPNEHLKLMLDIKKQLTDHVETMLAATETDIPLMIFDIAITFGGQTFMLPLNVELVEDFGKLLDRQIKTVGKY